MKKITFILLALIGGTSFAQTINETATSDTFAEIVSPITVKEGTTQLNFGTISGTATGGDVTINLNDKRSFTNSDMAISSAATISSARFLINAANTYSYTVDVTGTDLTNTGGDILPITFKHDRVSASRRIGSGADQELIVGGTITVADGQNAGNYAGEVSVTVAYE